MNQLTIHPCPCHVRVLWRMWQAAAAAERTATVGALEDRLAEALAEQASRPAVLRMTHGCVVRTMHTCSIGCIRPPTRLKHTQCSIRHPTRNAPSILYTHVTDACTRHHATPHHTTPHHTTPHHTTPHHTTPRHATPRHTTPHHAAPHHTTPHHTRAEQRCEFIRAPQNITQQCCIVACDVIIPQTRAAQAGPTRDQLGEADRRRQSESAALNCSAPTP